MSVAARGARLHPWSMLREEEVEAGRRIVQLERRMLGILEDVPEAKVILDRRGAGDPEVLSRGLLVERMKEATHALWELSKLQPDLRSDGRSAMSLLSEVDAIRWQLATSVKQVACGEARKKYGMTGFAAGVEDIEQDGMVGLYRAACRWDPERGLRFSTYATWWVRAEVQQREAEMQHPVTIRRRGHEIRLHAKKLLREAEMLNLSPAEGMEYAAERTGYTIEVLEQLIAKHAAYSLDQPATFDGEPGSAILKDYLPAPEDDPLTAIYAQDRAREVDDLLAKLGGDQRLTYIIKQRFGLTKKGEPQTLAAISSVLGVTRERVRQLQMQAVGLMRGRYMEVPLPKTTNGPPLTDRILDALRSGAASTRQLANNLLGNDSRVSTNAVRGACHRMAKPERAEVVQLGQGRSTKWALANSTDVLLERRNNPGGPKSKPKRPRHVWVGVEKWEAQPGTNVGDLWDWKGVIFTEGEPAGIGFRRDSVRMMLRLRDQQERGEIVSAIPGREIGDLTPVKPMPPPEPDEPEPAAEPVEPVEPVEDNTLSADIVECWVRFLTPMAQEAISVHDRNMLQILIDSALEGSASLPVALQDALAKLREDD